ncbi:hypothetical protein, partial [Bacteroides acidifaciens]|uniref:hypothetical protein n=1 Tax=Bacteroides acidifaciens TaxID=85831 RepID=UPI00214BFAB0
HDKALAWESRGFVYTKKRMHRFDTPSFIQQESDSYLTSFFQTFIQTQREMKKSLRTQPF